MRIRFFRNKLQLLLQLFFALIIVACSNNNKMKAPVAKKIAKELSIHENTRIDNYYWLNQRGDKDVEDYLNAENDYKWASNV